MILKDIYGIVDLDGSAVVKDKETGREIGTYSLRTILLKYLCLSDGHQLVAEIHQAKNPWLLFKQLSLILLRLKG
jgi:hypothetical protein